MGRIDEYRRFGEEKRIPQIRREEEAVFEAAVKAAAPTRILEVGTGVGYSALLMATWAPQATLVSLESFRERYEMACAALAKTAAAPRITLLYGEADEWLPQLEGEFDLVYLDGPKGHYLKHLLMLEPHLTATATVIADNVLFRGYVEGTVAVPRRMRTIAYRMRDYLAYVCDSGLYSTVLHRVGDGIAVSKRKGFR